MMNNMNPFANVFSQNPFMSMMGNNSAMQNPFSMWQDMWQNAAKQMGTACGMPVAQPQKTAFDPFSISPLMQGNPMAAYQQVMEFWQQFMPGASNGGAVAKADTPAGVWPFVGATGGSKPKLTVMTVELGDMAPYIKQATEFMSQWQNMWLQNMGSK